MDCLYCGKNLFRRKSYCNRKCKANLTRKQKFALIEETNGVRQDIRQLKKFLIEKKGHCCEICKNIIWQDKPIPLVLDHINGKARDGRLENLRLVCGNCDMQLPTYKSKNKNSERQRVGKW